MKLVTEESWEMLTWFADWSQGHTPVSMGRAPWLTTPFVQAMHEVRLGRLECEDRRRRRDRG